MLKRLIEVPINAENITTPTIFPSAIDDTILLGKSALIVSDKETASLISAVLFPASNPWPRLNNSANTIPVIAAKTVKPINDPIVFVVSFPRLSPFIFIITLVIDNNISGITNIFNKSINPPPTNPYHPDNSLIQAISFGESGNLATACTITPKTNPKTVPVVILVEKLTFFFWSTLITLNNAINATINAKVLKSLSCKNFVKKLLSNIPLSPVSLFVFYLIYYKPYVYYRI